MAQMTNHVSKVARALGKDPLQYMAAVIEEYEQYAVYCDMDLHTMEGTSKYIFCSGAPF